MLAVVFVWEFFLSRSNFNGTNDNAFNVNNNGELNDNNNVNNNNNVRPAISYYFVATSL